jgi:acyl carrier protein
LFDIGLHLDRAVAVPVRLDLAALAQLDQAAPAVLRGMVSARASRSGGVPGGSAASLRERLAGMPGQERHRVLVELIRTHSAAVLGRASATSVDATLAFKEQGFDSLTAVELRNRLDGATGHRLPPTLVFDFPNPAALARHLAGELVPEAAATGQDGPREADLSQTGRPPAVATLASATTDELFAFIDRELGTD